MRTMLKVEIPHHSGNTGTVDGSLGKTLHEVFERIRPEAAYFGATPAGRTVWAVFDLEDPTELCPTAEPLFQRLDATVEFIPCMNQEELAQGTAKAGY